MSMEQEHKIENTENFSELAKMYQNPAEAEKLLRSAGPGMRKTIEEHSEKVYANWKDKGGIPIYFLESDLGATSRDRSFGGRSTPPDLDMLDKFSK